jgi:HK97 family phage prohead protease/HK97 family phage major capsid protein
MGKKYDFSGWATKNNLRCSDGRTILRDAFKHNDGQTVPLVWNHQHNDPLNVLGHALLENRDSGVYAYCTFNDTEAGKNAKTLVQHGDVTALSIYANQLKQKGGNVEHGTIREVSLVLAGANPGAFIDSILSHGESSDEEGVIYTGETLVLSHADGDAPEKEEEKEVKDEKEKTVQDVIDSMTEEQRNVLYALVGQALEGEEEKTNKENEGDDKMKHNVFDNENVKGNNDVLSHAETEAILRDAKRYGSLRESCLQHGITNIDAAGYLFPEHQTLSKEPEFLGRDMGWVGKVMSSVHRTPFSRIKSLQADIREDEARALGYIKGKQKKDEVFTLLKRTTDPQTVYKKQKLHRDDVIDITDFDVVAFIKKEMRMMLEEEIARAVLIGDGRLSSSDDKIKDAHIRSIANDDALYAIHHTVTSTEQTPEAKAKAMIREALRARKDYKGSGEPTLFCSESVLTEMLLLEDANGRVIYDSVTKLATAMRVKEIVTVPVMEGAKNADKTKDILGIIVNLRDYNIGADKGGAVSMFEDFDIDYNAQKYLIETRCSGALIKPFSAIVLESTVGE